MLLPSGAFVCFLLKGLYGYESCLCKSIAVPPARTEAVWPLSEKLPDRLLTIWLPKELFEPWRLLIGSMGLLRPCPVFFSISRLPIEPVFLR